MFLSFMRYRYKIWFGRNLKVYQSKDLSPVKVVEEAMESVIEFKKLSFPKKGEDSAKLASDISK